MLQEKVEQEPEMDFSQPWDLSDAVLLVERERFHVHRGILAMYSPVFSRMFTSDFKEKSAEEVPLPRKKASEIREMLLIIYPVSTKPVDENNCSFLLALAQEYQMKMLTAKCEDFMLDSLKRERGCSVLNDLIVSESFNLERLRKECIGKTHDLIYEELKKHELYERVEPLSQHSIVELQMQKLERKLDASEKEAVMLRSQNQEMVRQAAQGLEHVSSIASVLAGHIRDANGVNASSIVFTDEQNMEAIRNDQDPQWYGRSTAASQKRKCKYMSEVCSQLEKIQVTLGNIQNPRSRERFITAYPFKKPGPWKKN